MTFAVSNPAEIAYAYGYAASSDTSIQYAYSKSNVAVSNMDVGYGWGLETDRWSRKTGFWGMTTQEIGNLFPRWHAARLNVGGNTQELINAWGMNFDVAKLEYAKFRKDLFIDTASLDDPDVFYHGDSVSISDRPVKVRNKNALANPSFAYRGLARRNTPLNWTTWRAMTTGTVELVEEPVFIGSYSAKMHAGPNEKCYLAQTRLLVIEKSYSITASLWYLCPIPDGLVAKDSRRACLYLSITYANGSMDMKRVPLDIGTNGNWRRASLTMKLERELHSVTFCVCLENDLSHDIKIYAGAAQIELGAVASPWEESSNTVVPYQNEASVLGGPVDAYIDFGTTPKTEEIVSGHPVTYEARKGRSLFYLPNVGQIWQEGIPFKAIPVAATGSFDPVSNDKWGWYSTPERERFNTRWRITNNKLEQYNETIPAEVVCSWDIGELYLDEDFRLDIGIYTTEEDPTFARTIEALCFINNRLWVMCKETEAGVTKRVIKILDPWSRWPVPLAYEQNLPCLHLECIADVDIGLATGTGSYLGFLESDPARLLIKIDNGYYFVDLQYNGYTYDFDRAQVIVRNQFDNGKLITV